MEEYFDEIKSLRNRLGLSDSEEALMAQIVDGLQDCVARQVGRQPYQDLHEILHLSIQMEHHIKKKTTIIQRNRSSTLWTHHQHKP